MVFRNTRYTYEHAHEHEITLPYCICLLQTTHVSRCDHVRDKGPDKDARGRISMANEGPNGPGVCGMHAGGRSRDLRAQTHTQAAARMCTIVGATAHRAIRQKDGYNVVGVKWRGISASIPSTITMPWSVFNSFMISFKPCARRG